ncbi:hypothetical protein SELMODRAFT_412542 [Selaginella moellendorffii]|uniref:Uncharacterized protein n=1 Tax=Selaginella moellendorffii TaxID=88036 RepID=D8RLT6_SELML|nr:hypothetical protein SELMODRAFT_412542 [Selaginella moellendorffii]
MSVDSEQLKHMAIEEAIDIHMINESAGNLMFAGYTLNYYGLRKNTPTPRGSRLRIDMTDFTGNESITVWMYPEVAEKRSQQFARGKWLKIIGFEVVPAVPKYDRGTWRYTLKISHSTVIEEFFWGPPVLRLPVQTLSIANFIKLHRGRDAVGSIEAVMIKANYLSHNSAEIIVADNCGSDDTLMIKFLSTSIEMFRELMCEFLSGKAPVRCFINLQGDGMYKRANVTGMTIITPVIEHRRIRYLTTLYRSIGTSCEGIPGWFEIDNRCPLIIHMVCGSCNTTVTKRVSKNTAICASCNYTGPIKQHINLQGHMHSKDMTISLNNLELSYSEMNVTDIAIDNIGGLVADGCIMASTRNGSSLLFSIGLY